jgi:hypothetical protein
MTFHISPFLLAMTSGQLVVFSPCLAEQDRQARSRVFVTALGCQLLGFVFSHMHQKDVACRTTANRSTWNA